MYCIEVPKEINNMMSLFYYIGFWHRGDKPSVSETRIKLFYCFYYLLFPLSFVAGAMKNTNLDEKIFLVGLTIAAAVMSLKLCYIIWKKDQILEMITRIGVYSMENREEFTLANDKMKKFTKFVVALILTLGSCGYIVAFAPFFGQEKILVFNIGFPLDWKNNEIAFWFANAFIFTETSLSIIIFQFSIIIWYLMINCSLRYKILGNNIKNVGVICTSEASSKRKILQVEYEKSLLRDLVTAIDSHQHIRKLINQFGSFAFNMFFIQIVTSGLCICGAIYCLAFNVSDTKVGHLYNIVSLLYNICDIFMIMHLGNEIKLSSDRLSYCLFESNWIDKSQKTKKCMIVFGELLKQPHELVVGKLYPLTLETFRRILNFAYNTFNILKNFK